MTDATVAEAPAAPSTRSAGHFLYISGVVLLCAWVLVPIYFLLVNTLSSPDTVNSFPKPLFPEFDFGSLAFFAQFAGMLTALKNSVLTAGMTMIMSILIGAPAGYALSRFDFRGKELFRLLILLTRAFPLPLLALPLAVMFIQTGLDDTTFGLAAGVVSKDVSRAHRIIHRLEAGICWINTWGESPAEMPVGGYKESGVGRENGISTLGHYTRIKSVQVELGDYASVF